MKKLFSAIIALMVVIAAFPVMASADGIKVLFQNEAIVFPDAQPYKSQSDVMIPIRQSAQALGMKTSFNKSSNEIHLTVAAIDIAFKIGSGKATVNGSAVVEFGAAAVSKQNRVYVPLSFFKEVLRLETSYNAANNEAVISTTKSDGAVLPEALVEEEVVVNAQSPFAVKGTLTMPKNASAPLPAVVLVHGSGPSDRDETVGGYKPFRDIAWGLAQQGVAVLRYDKRTFTHGRSYTPDMLATFTVKQETVDDAISAAKLLKSDKRIDAQQVYLIGHSLGGMLTPRIDADGGDFAGLIVMAGSARPLWQISHDQNEAFIKAMDDKDPAKKANQDWLTAELAKAQNIKNMTDEEVMKAVIFGMPAYYLKEMDSHSAADLAPKLSKPILIMQGEDDFQVNQDKDFTLWQTLLKDNPKAAFKLYPGLNHFFINYSGEDKGTVKEYSHPGNVDSQVIQDIANWILNK